MLAMTNDGTWVVCWTAVCFVIAAVLTSVVGFDPAVALMG